MNCKETIEIQLVPSHPFGSAHKVSDAQRRFEVASLYRQHVEQVGQDRSLEDFVQAAAWISRAC